VTERALRHESFGEMSAPNTLDRVGRWLSTRRVRRLLGNVTGARAADVGCGFDGALGRLLFSRSAELLLIDISVDRSRPEPRIKVLEGYLPDVLGQVESGCLDAIVCNNVIEHLWEPVTTLRELHRVLAPGGRLVVNVPSWRGKFFLELAAFRLGLAPKQEMDDHKTYYDPRELWPLLIAAGFRPSGVTCRRHKFGLNTIARCSRPT
jgi:SAM-dependent methyltransferase